MPDREDVDRILGEAYAALARTAELRVVHRDVDPEDDILVRRVREMRERGAPPKRARTLDTTPAPVATSAEQQRKETALIDERIAAALDGYSEAVGRVISAERTKFKSLLAAERAALDETVEVFLADLEKQLGVDRGTVVDLPAIPLRGRRVA